MKANADAHGRLLESIHRAKTGALLRASVRMGAIYAGAANRNWPPCRNTASMSGLAFQIVDDVLDVEQSSEALGKTAGKDQAQQKDHISRGLRAANIRAGWRKMSGCAAHQALEPLGGRAERLREIADFIVQRKA